MSEIPIHGICRSVFLQPIKLLKISIAMRSWNYTLHATVRVSDGTDKWNS